METQLPAHLQNSEQSTDQLPSGCKSLMGPCHGPQLLCLLESSQYHLGGHLPCMSKTGCRASWCRGRWPHSGCQGQTLFLSKAYRHYQGLIKHSFLYFENKRRNLETDTFLTWIQSMTSPIEKIYNMWAPQSSSRPHRGRGSTVITWQKRGRANQHYLTSPFAKTPRES